MTVFSHWMKLALAFMRCGLLGGLRSVLVFAVFGSLSVAQATPAAKPIKIVVGFGAGGAMDTLARAVAGKLAARLQRPVYVENRAGAGGGIAAAYVAQSRPDGNTLLLASPGEIFVNPIYNKSVKANDIALLVPVAKISSAPLVLVTTSESAIHQVSDIAGAAAKNPQGLSFASSGIGSLQHLVGDRLSKGLGVELVHVPYSGASTATASLLGHQVDLLFAGLAPVAPFIENKKLRVLGVASGRRTAKLPDVPTLQEKGLQGRSLEYWQGFFLPRGASPELALSLSAEVGAMLKDASLIRQLESLGFDAEFRSCNDFKSFLRTEAQGYQTIAASL